MTKHSKEYLIKRIEIKKNLYKRVRPFIWVFWFWLKALAPVVVVHNRSFFFGELRMMILEYDNLGLFVKHNNSGYSLTEYKDEASSFSNCEVKGRTLELIENQLSKGDDFFKKGCLIAKEI